MLPLNLSCHHHLGPFALSCQLNRLSSKYCCFEGNENFAFSREKELRRTKIFHSLKIRYGIYCCHFWYKYQWALDQFIIFLLSLQKCQAVLYYMLLDLQMFEKVFSSKRVRSISSRNHLFHKALNMGRSCPNQVWAITFDWSALATWNKHFWTAFW